MVLKSILSLVSLLCLLHWGGNEGPLFQNYKSKINKQLKSSMKEEFKEDSFENMNFDFHNLEGYKINCNQTNKLKGYLFLKEVKACSLNGCVAKDQKVDNLNSEYYDISVLTSPDMTIQSIKILDYFSDYGYEISSKKYLKKYQGKRLCEFAQEDELVDGISGATISYNGLVNSLIEFCELTN